jgi:hypothetical protein
MCKECIKATGFAISASYVGGKMAYGPSYRAPFVNETVGTIMPGAVKDASEIYVSLFHHLAETDPDFVPSEHLTTRVYKIMNTKVAETGN